MPPSSDLLAGLTQIANEGLAMAVGWHVAIAAVLLSMVMGWRPSRRTTAFGLSLPLFSVAGVAVTFGSFFNAGVFFVVAIAAMVVAASRTQAPIHRPTWHVVVLGAAMVAFGWVYPHFLIDRPLTAYLYAAPVGLVPCPTLALVLGATLLCGGLGRPWAVVLAATSAFYGLFGVFRLGVFLDLGLLLGAAGVAFVSLRRGSREAGEAASELVDGAALAAQPRHEGRSLHP
jgi:hypothetical protein